MTRWCSTCSSVLKSSFSRFCRLVTEPSWCSVTAVPTPSALRSLRRTRSVDFIAASLDTSGLMRVTVKPKRKDELLIDGVIILTPDTGDLLRVEGRLAKSPSFWIGRIDVVRTYDRIGGVRVPVRTESVAQGKNGRRVEFRDELRVRNDQWSTRRISFSCCPQHTVVPTGSDHHPAPMRRAIAA